MGQTRQQGFATVGFGGAEPLLSLRATRCFCNQNCKYCSLVRIRVCTFNCDEHCEGVDGEGIAAMSRAVVPLEFWRSHNTQRFAPPEKKSLMVKVLPHRVVQNVKEIKIHLSCEIENFLETPLCTLRMILRSGSAVYSTVGVCRSRTKQRFIPTGNARRYFYA